MMQVNKDGFFDPICARVKALAAEKGLANIELAGLADVSYRTIHSVMHGQARPRNRIIGRIAKALGVSAEYLITGKGSKQSAPMMVREGMVCPERGDPEPIPDKLHRAVAVIAEQLNIPRGEILDAVCDLAKKKLEAEAKGA